VSAAGEQRGDLLAAIIEASRSLSPKGVRGAITVKRSDAALDGIPYRAVVRVEGGSDVWGLPCRSGSEAVLSLSLELTKVLNRSSAALECSARALDILNGKDVGEP